MVLLEKEGEGKLNAEEYCDQILDKELFDFWLMSMEELGDVLVMEDGAPYDRGIALVHRKQYEDNGLSSWGPEVWPTNSPNLNPIENLWHILQSNVRKRRPWPMKKSELIEALKEEWCDLT